MGLRLQQNHPGNVRTKLRMYTHNCPWDVLIAQSVGSYIDSDDALLIQTEEYVSTTFQGNSLPITPSTRNARAAALSTEVGASFASG